MSKKLNDCLTVKMSWFERHLKQIDKQWLKTNKNKINMFNNLFKLERQWNNPRLILKNLMEKSFKQWAAVSLQIIKVKTVPVHHFYPIGLARNLIEIFIFTPQAIPCQKVDIDEISVVFNRLFYSSSIV